MNNLMMYGTHKQNGIKYIFLFENKTFFKLEETFNVSRRINVY